MADFPPLTRAYIAEVADPKWPDGLRSLYSTPLADETSHSAQRFDETIEHTSRNPRIKRLRVAVYTLTEVKEIELPEAS